MPQQATMEDQRADSCLCLSENAFDDNTDKQGNSVDTSQMPGEPQTPSVLPKFSNPQRIAPLLPPPPPPSPPPGIPSGTINFSYKPDEEVQNLNQFIPPQYADDPTTKYASRVLWIKPFGRKVLITHHLANAADYGEFKWLLEHGSSGIWYEKPTKAHLRSIRTLQANGRESDELPALRNARPVSLETPKVCASAAMTTPTDNYICKCVADHGVDDGYTGKCQQCTETKSEALKSTPLVYCLVFTTCQAADPFIHGGHFNGRQIYKLVKCGSREAAVAEAFYAAGVNGWSLAFSCVMKLGEDFEERPGTAKKVSELWMLAEEEKNENTFKVFY